MTAFYDLIDHDLLLRKVRKYFTDAYSLALLERLLLSWASGSGGYRFGHGIPQGPEASAFLADLFLYELDKKMLNESCKYVRYVDDIRVFCPTRREAEARIAEIEQEVKQLGLVLHAKKVGVIDARANTDWLKEESSEALVFKIDLMEKPKPPKSLQRLRHLLAKPTFMRNCRDDPEDTKATYLTRLSLPQLLPDKQVAERILGVYSKPS